MKSLLNVLLLTSALMQGLEAQEPLRFNEIQCIGSHNSYRKHTDPKIERFVLGLSGFLPAEYNPQAWDYAHVPLSDQLTTFGMRSFELDIHYDPEGDLFSKPAGRLLTGRKRKLDDPAWEKPGMKLIHIADFDYNSHHVLFKDALAEIRDWSARNPTHLPLVVMVELKTFGVGSMMPLWPFTRILPFDGKAMDEIDQEIEDVFAASPNKVFTPDDFRGKHADIETAKEEEGWPDLDSLRGKILFVGMMSEEERSIYKYGNVELEGRKMFVFEDSKLPSALFIKIDDPTENLAEIQRCVKAGMIVRTRADADTREARSGDFTRLKAAIESGAQIISTDYYKADDRGEAEGWSGYKAQLPNGQSAMPNTFLRPDWLSTFLPL